MRTKYMFWKILRKLRIVENDNDNHILDALRYTTATFGTPHEAIVDRNVYKHLLDLTLDKKNKQKT